MAEVDPGCPSFCHLVKQVIPEKLQQVAVARLRPRWVLLKPDTHTHTHTTQGHRVVTEQQITHMAGCFRQGLLTLASR